MPERPEKRTEGRVVDGVYQPANACAECGKWIPPWKGAVPASVADAYCWGRHPDNGRAETPPKSDENGSQGAT